MLSDRARHVRDVSRRRTSKHAGFFQTCQDLEAIMVIRGKLDLLLLIQMATCLGTPYLHSTKNFRDFDQMPPDWMNIPNPHMLGLQSFYWTIEKSRVWSTQLQKKLLRKSTPFSLSPTFRTSTGDSAAGSKSAHGPENRSTQAASECRLRFVAVRGRGV